MENSYYQRGNTSGMMPQGPPSRQAIGVRLGNSANPNMSQGSINNRSYFGASQKSIPGPHMQMYNMNQSRVGRDNEDADVPYTDRS